MASWVRSSDGASIEHGVGDLASRVDDGGAVGHHLAAVRQELIEPEP